MNFAAALMQLATGLFVGAPRPYRAPRRQVKRSKQDRLKRRAFKKRNR